MLKKTIAISLTTFIFACSNNTTTSTEQNTGTDTAKKETPAEQLNEFADFEFHSLVINIPSPFEVIGKLAKSNFAYDNTLPNPTSNASKYATSSSKAMNYGVYIVDLIYLSTNEQYVGVKDYFITTREFAKSLQCEESFDKLAGKSLEKNIDNKDTINKVIDAVFVEMDSYLRNNDRLITATEILVGSWVESQYITTKTIKDAEQNDANAVLFKKIGEQKFTADKLAEILKQFEKEKELKSIIAEVSNLQKVYGEYKEGALTKDYLNKVYKSLESARTKITK